MLFKNMFQYCDILLVIIVIFNCSLVNATSSIYHTSHENMKETSHSVNKPVIESLRETGRVRRSIDKRDAFDDLLDVDEETDMDLYRDVLVSELDGVDKTLLDRKLGEAENMSWIRKSAYHRYAMQIFDDVKRYHEIRTNVTDYNV